MHLLLQSLVRTQNRDERVGVTWEGAVSLGCKKKQLNSMQMLGNVRGHWGGLIQCSTIQTHTVTDMVLPTHTSHTQEHTQTHARIDKQIHRMHMLADSHTI